MRSSIIRPGLLVALKTSLIGGVSYEQVTIDPDHAVGKARVAKWETKRTIVHAEEHQAATVARSKVRTLLRAVCAETNFGLICPKDKAGDLESAIAEAKTVVTEHNRGAKHTKVDFWILTGEIADNDLQAQRAIASEMKELLAAMEEGIKAADPAAVREAANKARRVAGMLTPAASEKVSKAIEEARTAARDIVRRVEKAGEEAAEVIAEFKLTALKSARFSALDLGDGGDEPAAAPVVAAGRKIDDTPAPAAPSGQPFARPKARTRAAAEV